MKVKNIFLYDFNDFYTFLYWNHYVKERTWGWITDYTEAYVCNVKSRHSLILDLAVVFECESLPFICRSTCRLESARSYLAFILRPVTILFISYTNFLSLIIEITVFCLARLVFYVCRYLKQNLKFYRFFQSLIQEWNGTIMEINE